MKGVALFSSGIDSPVATYLMLKRGFDVTAVHMDARPHTDDAGVGKARDLVSKVSEAGGRPVKLFVVPNAGFYEAVVANCNPKLHCILCKRFMYRIAEAIARKEGADYIITGESLGQVASQTTENIVVLEAAVSMPVLRPLIGFDKVDTIKIAREIGTYDISSRKSAACPFVPKKPATHAKIGDALIEENKIGVGALVDEALANAQVI